MSYSEQQMDYNSRHVLSKFIGKTVNGTGVVISKENINTNGRVWHNVCLASVKLNLNGKMVEFDHLNVHIKKNRAFQTIRVFENYRFKGEAYRYFNQSSVDIGGQFMTASLESYSLKDATHFLVIDPAPKPNKLSIFQASRSRKLNMDQAALIKLPYGERESRIIQHQESGGSRD